MGSLYVCGRLSTYPFPEPTLTLTSLLGQNVGLGEEYVGRFPETYNDPKYVPRHYRAFSHDITAAVLVQLCIPKH